MNFKARHLIPISFEQLRTNVSQPPFQAFLRAEVVLASLDRVFAAACRTYQRQPITGFSVSNIGEHPPAFNLATVADCEFATHGTSRIPRDDPFAAHTEFSAVAQVPDSMAEEEADNRHRKID